MSRLFINIDYTLVRPLTDARFLTNRKIIEYVLKFCEANPDGIVIYWSDKGKEYANKWMNLAWNAMQVKHPNCHIGFTERYAIIPEKDDIFIDISPYATYRHKSLNPELQEFTKII